jgi:hypothetical protein
MVSASPKERDDEGPFGPQIDEAEAEESDIQADADVDVSSSDEPSTEEE